MQDFPKDGDRKVEEGDGKFNMNSLSYSQMLFNSVRKHQPEGKSNSNNHNAHNGKENSQVMEEYREINKSITQT